MNDFQSMFLTEPSPSHHRATALRLRWPKNTTLAVKPTTERCALAQPRRTESSLLTPASWG